MVSMLNKTKLLQKIHVKPKSTKGNAKLNKNIVSSGITKQETLKNITFYIYL